MRAGRRRQISAAVALAAVGALLAAIPISAGAPEPLPPSANPPGQGQLKENATTGVIEGAFISFEAPASGAIVANYTSEGVLFFAKIAVGGYALVEKAFVGPLVRVVGTGAEVQAHDVPSSILRVRLDPNGTANFELPAGVRALAGPNGTVSVAVASSNRTASVWSDCGASALAVAADHGSFEVVSGSTCYTFFRSRVLDPSAEALITSAAEAGQLAAEVSVGAAPAQGVDVTAFGEASAIVSHADGRVVVSVASQSNRPASVVVRFVAPGEGQATQILVDGHPAKQAESLEDALDPTDDGGAVEYVVSGYDSTGLLVVSMPSAGTHVIEIQSVAAAAPTPSGPSPLLAAGLALAVVAGAAVALFRRRD